jgi:hypothetical protein
MKSLQAEEEYLCTKCGWEGPSGFSMQWWEHGKPEASMEFRCCPKCYIDWLQQSIPYTLKAKREWEEVGDQIIITQRRPDTPQSALVERVSVLEEICRDICSWDWSDNDDEPLADIERLRAALRTSEEA